jgi:hypothetical protein
MFIFISLFVYLMFYLFIFINLFMVYLTRLGSRVSSGSIVSDYGLDDRAIGVRFLCRYRPLRRADHSSRRVLPFASIYIYIYIYIYRLYIYDHRNADKGPCVPSWKRKEN